jgi:hypothetical protein
MSVTATLEALDICLLSSRSRGRSFRIGGEGYKWDRSRLNLIHRRLLAPLGDDGLVVAARGLVPSATRSAGTGFRAPVVVMGAGVIAAPLRGTRPLALPAAAVVIVERPTANRELVLSLGLGNLGEGAFPRVALVSITIHGRRRGVGRSGVGELLSRSGSRTAADVRESG